MTNKKKQIIGILWLLSILVSVVFGGVIGIVVKSQQSEQKDQRQISTEPQDLDWKEFYDERIGLYLKYPSDCKDIILKEADPDSYSYVASSKCSNDKKVNISINRPLYGLDLDKQKGTITLDDKQIKIVLTKSLDETLYIACMEYDSELKNIFSDSINISLETENVEDWVVYQEIMKSIKINQYYKDWEMYKDEELGFSFKYPTGFTVNDDWIYDGIMLVSPWTPNLLFYINMNPQFTKKVHEDNYELITSNFNNSDISKVKVYCTNQLEESDTFCSSEEPISDYDPTGEKTLEAIFYSENITQEDDYYYIGDFKQSKKNFVIGIEMGGDKGYTYSDSFRYLELIINSIEFANS